MCSICVRNEVVYLTVFPVYVVEQCLRDMSELLRLQIQSKLRPHWENKYIDVLRLIFELLAVLGEDKYWKWLG